jgi:hypothetical protein
VPSSRHYPDKLAALGYRVSMRSTEALRRAVRELVAERR